MTDFSSSVSLCFICVHISGACLTENGALKVNKHLQVEGFDNVYAVGDCANVNEPKLAYHAGLHAGVAATNIINSLSGKALTSYHTGNNHKPMILLQLSFASSLLKSSFLTVLLQYIQLSFFCFLFFKSNLYPISCSQSGNVTMLIAMGKDAGVGQFNGYKLPRFLVTKGKSQGLLLWKSWREMEQKAPN